MVTRHSRRYSGSPERIVLRWSSARHAKPTAPLQLLGSSTQEFTYLDALLVPCCCFYSHSCSGSGGGIGSSSSSRGDARSSAAAAAARRMEQARPMSLREKAAQKRAAASNRQNASANTARVRWRRVVSLYVAFLVRRRFAAGCWFVMRCSWAGRSLSSR